MGVAAIPFSERADIPFPEQEGHHRGKRHF